MPNNQQNDDILFEQLKKAKKRKHRKIIVTVVTIVVLVLIAVAAAVSILRARVRERFNRNTADVKSYSAVVGRISTTVSGTGVLAAVDEEAISVPSGVEVEEVLVAAGDTLKAGDPIAKVKMSSVMTALSDTQKSLEKLDDQISDSKNDAVKSYVTTAIGGRVKRIFAEPDQNVVDVMTEHGALAVLSIDGCMVVTIDAALESRQSVTVQTENGKTYPGTVEHADGATAAITLTDDGPLYGETVQVFDGETLLGKGTLDIHNPLAVTGYAGTIQRVNVKENQKLWNGGNLFTLTDTKYSANYDALLQTRADTEKTLNDLIAMLRTGSVTAPFDGMVISVDYSEDGSSSASTASAASAYLAAAAASSRTASASSDTALVTLAPDTQVSVTLGVDETDILSLQLGQTAEITVSSIGDDKLPGVVTEITRVGTSYSGVTQYSAVVTLDKTPAMLTGMTATVDIQIQGTDEVVLIPVDALHQTRNRAYVYTSYNEETKEYGDMVDVVAGVSNSSYVEIVSGLNPGDTVYYTERNTFNFFNMMPGMSGMGSSTRPGSNSRNQGSFNRQGGSTRAPGMGG